jgi:hypothetical protein
MEPFLILTMLLAAGENASSPSTGTICVAALDPQSKTVDHDMPENIPQRREPSYEFSIHVDRQEPVAVPKDGKPRSISQLGLDAKHLVRIRDAGELIESFWFTFEERGSTTLCLSYGPWYQTWTLDPPGRQPWCDCRSAK